jgi:ubiquinone/menaquinone biosynthesis C-methylase UbiE
MESNQTPAVASVKAKIMETYDNIATHYNAWTDMINTPTRSLFFNKLVACLPQNSVEKVSILELGCGGGLPFTKALLSIPNTIVFANDISEAQIGIAKQNLAEFGDRVTCKQGDMMQLDFPDASLDAVVGLYTIIHLPREEQTEMVAKIYRWLKPGGHLLVNFTSSADEVNVNPNWLVDKGWMFWSGWGADRSLEMVKNSALDILHSEIKGDSGDGTFLWVLARKA